MGIRSWISNRRFKRSKTYELGSAILNGQIYLGDENILSSSDIYHYMSAISNMFACGKWKVEDLSGKDITDDPVLKTLKRPNGYLSGFEFKKLVANVYLINGETFIVKDQSQLHVMKGIQPEITDQAIKVFKYNGHTLFNNEVAQIKNIGLSNNHGSGLAELAKDTLEGVMNAEKSLTEKYKKGGLLAYLLKLDTHLSPKNAMQNEMVDAIQNKLAEIQDEGKTIIIPLSKGYNIEGFESKVDDEKTLSYLKVYKPEIAKFLGFEPDVYSSKLKTNLEEAAIYLKACTVDPFIENVCEQLTFLFFGADSNKQITLNIDMKKYLTMSQKIVNASSLVRSMIYTPDDGRVDLGHERLGTPESSSLYASKDLIGLDELSALNEAKVKEGENTG